MKTGLYRNLPFVEFEKDFLIFSPYQSQIVRVSQKAFESSELENALNRLNFFEENNFNRPLEIRKIGFTVTSDCNLCCKHCYSKVGNNPLYMVPELALEILNSVVYSCHTNNPLVVSFFGGEPTLNMKTIQAIVERITLSDIPAHYHITTNGVIKPEHLYYIIKNNMDVTVSMEGTPEINKYIRLSKSKLDTSWFVEQTIKKLVENNTLFQIRTTLSELNIDWMCEFVDYCGSLGVRYIHFEPVSLDGRAREYSFRLPSPESFIEKFKEVLDQAAEKGIKVISSFYMNLLTPSDYFCTSLHDEKLLINPDGSVSTCYKVQSHHDSYDEFIIGAFNIDSTSLVFDEQKKKSLRQFSVNNFAECKDCFAKFICSGGCPHRNLLTTGKMNNPDIWVCNVKKGLIKDAIVRLYRAAKSRKYNTILGTYFYEQEIIKKLIKKGQIMKDAKKNSKQKNKKPYKELVSVFSEEGKTYKEQSKSYQNTKLERSEACF